MAKRSLLRGLPDRDGTHTSQVMAGKTPTPTVTPNPGQDWIKKFFGGMWSDWKKNHSGFGTGKTKTPTPKNKFTPTPTPHH